MTKHEQSSGQTVRAEAIYLWAKYGRIGTMDDFVDETEAAINAHIVSVLEQNIPNLDGVNPNSKDFHAGFELARQEYIDAIAKYKQETK